MVTAVDGGCRRERTRVRPGFCPDGATPRYLRNGERFRRPRLIASIGHCGATVEPRLADPARCRPIQRLCRKDPRVVRRASAAAEFFHHGQPKWIAGAGVDREPDGRSRAQDRRREGRSGARGDRESDCGEGRSNESRRRQGGCGQRSSRQAAAEKAARKRLQQKGRCGEGRGRQDRGGKDSRQSSAGDDRSFKALAEEAAPDTQQRSRTRSRGRRDAERPRQDAATSAEAAFAYAAGLNRGSASFRPDQRPIIFRFGGVVFLRRAARDAVQWRDLQPPRPTTPAVSIDTSFDRLVTAVLAEQRRRDSKQNSPAAPEREQRTDDAAVH